VTCMSACASEVLPTVRAGADVSCVPLELLSDPALELVRFEDFHTLKIVPKRKLKRCE
jgi:hypothetical protein